MPLHLRRILSALVLLPGLLLVPPGMAKEPSIVIGQVIDLSGPNGAIGRDYVAGIKTQFDALNAAGGIHGRRIEYLVRDDHGQADMAVAAATELLDASRAQVLLGGVGDLVTQAIVDSPAFRNSGSVLLGPLALTAGRNDSRVVYWRPSYVQELQFLLAYFAKLGIKDVGVFYQESAFYRQAYESVFAEIRKRGMTVTGTVKMSGQGKDFDQKVARLAASKPGFVLSIGDTLATGLFLKRFRSHAPQVIVAGDSLSNLATLKELAGASAVEWTVFSQVVSNPAAAQTGLQIEHQKAMKRFRDEDLSSLTLEGFAVAKTLAIALQGGASTRTQIHAALAERRPVDLGGFIVGSTGQNQRLSGFIDVALFRKGAVLVF
jgi:branched-chain amino acid transport system substrate-binding protein